MIAVMNVPKMDEAPASAAAAAEAVPEHMGALSVGNDYGYGKVEDVRATAASAAAAADAFGTFITAIISPSLRLYKLRARERWG